MLLIVLIGCKKSEQEPDPTPDPTPDPVPLQYPDHIIAGKKSGNGIVYSGSLGIEIHHMGYNTIKQWVIDLNNDSVNDCILVYYINVEASGYSHYEIYVKPNYYSSCWFALSEFGENWTDTIPTNISIDSTLSWFSGKSIIYDYFRENWPPASSVTKGVWFGAKNKYIGVRAFEGENIVYGWISIEVEADGLLKFIDYACTTGY